MIYIIKQEGLYQNKVNSSLASIHNCKMAYYVTMILGICQLHCDVIGYEESDKQWAWNTVYIKKQKTMMF